MSRGSYDFFENVLGNGLPPCQFTFSSFLSACASVLYLRWGKKVHGHSITIGFEKDVFVGSALLLTCILNVIILILHSRCFTKC